MAVNMKYVKALVPINLFGGALWMEEEDIVKIPESLFNSTEVQAAITANEVIEVLSEDLTPDVVSPTVKLRGEWDPSNGQLPVGRRIGDTYLVNAPGIAPYDNLLPGYRVLFRTLTDFEILNQQGEQGPPGPQGDPGLQGPQGDPGLDGQNSVSIWEYKNADFNIVGGVGYIVDTTNTIITGTLPATLSSTFYTEIKDAAGTFGSNSFFIAPYDGSYTVVGGATPLEVDVPSPILSLAYDTTNNNVVI